MMQKVPEIRIFSSSQSWRKSPKNYEKKFIETLKSTSDKSSQYRTYQTNTHYSNFQRSASVTQNKQKNPFQTNYYENAIRICEQNSLINKVKSHELNDLNSAYIVKGCRKTSKEQCLQCQAELRKRRMNESFSIKSATTSFKVTNPPTIPLQIVQQNTYQTEKQNIKNFMNSQLSSNRNNYLNFNQKELPKYTNSKKPMTFQEIITSNENLHTFREIKEGTQKQQVTQQAKKQQSCRSGLDYNARIIEQSHCGTLTIQQSNSKNSKLFQPKPYLFPEISCLILQLNNMDLSNDLQNTFYMIKQLQDAAQKDLKLRKNCINKLDQIIRKYGSPKYLCQQQGHIIVEGNQEHIIVKEK